MPSKWTSRRSEQLDRARVGLFALGLGERPIEASGAVFEAAWPASTQGTAFSPEEAAAIDIGTPGVIETLGALHLSTVVLLTYSHFRWCPHRTYRGRLMYGNEADQIFSAGAVFDSDAIYEKFPHTSLGARSVKVADIAYVSLDEFVASEMAVVKVQLLDGSPDLASEHSWPSYDSATVTRFLGLADHGPTLTFTVTGVASLNFAVSMNRGFDFLQIPFRTENLEPGVKAKWDTLSSRPLKTAWEPLFQRLYRES